MEPNKGTLNKELDPLTLNHVSQPEAYLGFARDLMDAVRLLDKLKSHQIRPIIFLSGQIVENVLKAHLLEKGFTDQQLKLDFGHNLIKLWQSAFASDPPDWLKQLDEFHNNPARSRYPIGGHGFVSPSKVQVLEGLDELFNKLG